MPAGHGLHSSMRDLFARPFLTKGNMDVKVNGVVHYGMPHNFFHGRNGRARRRNRDQQAAIATVVTITEILKNNGLAVEKKIMTSTVDVKDESRDRPIQKAKIEIILGKTENFDELMDAVAEERDAADGEEQS